MIKTCNKCKKEKSLSEFYYRKDTKKYRKDCKSCKEKQVRYFQNRSYEKYHSQKYRSMYKISGEEYSKLMETTSCMVCGKENVDLVFDHCHNKKHVRGRLCNKCNMGLGHFNDDIGNLLSAIEYLLATEEV